MFRRSIKLIRRDGRNATLSTRYQSYSKSHRCLAKDDITSGSECTSLTTSSHLQTSSHFSIVTCQNTSLSADLRARTTLCQGRSYTTAPPLTNNQCLVVSPSPSLHARSVKNHQRTIKRGKVFVSKHNQSLNVTSSQIVECCRNQGINTDDDIRTTSTHVILRECPFCDKPTKGQADNMYKLYVQIGGGAYFCHRCGSKGEATYNFMNNQEETSF